MTVAAFEKRIPQIGADSYIHPSADVLGDVQIGEGCWIGPGARIRGDYGRIVIGNCTTVEDNVVVHARPGEQTTIGDWVTLGHGCVIHNPKMIGNYSIIGMCAVVSDWTVLGEWAVVGEGAVVPQSREIPAGRIAVGVPAKILDRPVAQDFRDEWTRFKALYVDLARRYPEGWQPLE